MRFILFICFLNVIVWRRITPPLYQRGIWRQIKMRFAEQMIEDAGRAPGHQAQAAFSAAVAVDTGIHRINPVLLRPLPLKVKIR